MNSPEFRKLFFDFFKSRKHQIVPPSSLVPKDDSSVLLTTAGMQQFKPYFLGLKDPIKDFGARNTASIQKCFRTSDIDEVGDESHLTFFEMLGHFSFGEYFKKETIAWTFEFLTKTLEINPERISASIFAGDSKIPKDQESYDVWLQFLPAQKIKLGSREDGNIWGPAGPEGSCGACNEVYVDGLEIATLVFMEYFYSKDGSLTPLDKKGVDVGWGFERALGIVQDAPTVFETDLFLPLIQAIPHKANGLNEARSVRIIADHIKGAVFLIADGVFPSNLAQGYILRRILRRALRHCRLINAPDNLLISLAQKVTEMYKEFYPELAAKREDILTVIQKESEKFSKTLEKGLREFEKIVSLESDKTISGEKAFYLYESFGFPMELTRELAGERNIGVDEIGWQAALKAHQEISRAGAEKKFGGHGLTEDQKSLPAGQGGKIKNQNEKEDIKKITRLHTATHLLNQALHDVLDKEGSEIKQMGSDINTERTRFDFSFPRKLTSEEIKQTEDIVNKKIKENLPVTFEEVPKEKALKIARGAFGEKYPDKVTVYSIGEYSKEICGGPHVKYTSEIGKFEIKKEASSSAGVRRIRAVVE